jgi:hypothetical protein
LIMFFVWFPKTPVDLAFQLHRTSVLDVLELYIGSDPRYADFQDEFKELLRANPVQ